MKKPERMTKKYNNHLPIAEKAIKELFELFYYGLSHVTAENFLKRLNAAVHELNTLLTPNKDDIKVSFEFTPDDGSDYGGTYIGATVVEYRSETEEEFQKRLKDYEERVKYNREKAKKAYETKKKNELALYEQLKAKYEKH